MQAKYKLLINHLPLLENDNSSKLVSGYNPGHTLGTGDQEPHRRCSVVCAGTTVDNKESQKAG
ncbi:hypothetical protein DSO57_1021340, partial [Entomophthora muscae]